MLRRKDDKVVNPLLSQSIIGYTCNLSYFLTFLYMAIITTSSAAITSLAVVLAVGGTSALAETTEPGDFLYPVKIGFNENIRAGLSFSTVSNIKLETDLALRRLSEAKELAADDTLNIDTRVQLEESFVLHHENAMRISGQASHENANEKKSLVNIMSDYHANLTAEEQAMMELRPSDQEVKGQLSVMIAVVLSAKAEAKEKADSLYAEANGSMNDMENTAIDTETNAEAQAQADVDTANTVLQEMRADLDATIDLSAELRTQAEADLRSAEDAISKAAIEVRNKAYSEARSYASDAKDIMDSTKKRIEGSLDTSVKGEVKTEGSLESDVTDAAYDAKATGSVGTTGGAL